MRADSGVGVDASLAERQESFTLLAGKPEVLEHKESRKANCLPTV